LKAIRTGIRIFATESWSCARLLLVGANACAAENDRGRGSSPMRERLSAFQLGQTEVKIGDQFVAHFLSAKDQNNKESRKWETPS